MQKDRLSEWFVPKFGTRNFRLGIGILFLPYTGMVVAFAAWGSLVVDYSLERLVAICLLYFLALGISAHCLDALGSKTKPWGFLSKKKLWIISLITLSAAIIIGFYYAFLDSPLLIPIGIVEIFFLVSYNLELFNGKFHNNSSFVLSWGVLPVLAGTIIQINSVTLESFALSGVAGILSYILIKTSRIYKNLKKQSAKTSLIYKKEIVLKLISSGVILSTVLFFLIRHL
ncbi:MAG: hypothetical protein XU09_C0004G0244 [Thaumarchaeota archaeon CSP1-1]|nr:MAG: hypothetical protein XU09_C0004G0244 [Thaumarchaeota archaeon CSP1-1]